VLVDWTDAGAGAEGAAGVTALTLPDSTTDVGTALPGFGPTGVDVPGAAAGAETFLAAAFFTGAAATGRASLSLRTTGASTVDDGLLTYSPSSFSLARTTLLVTPSSLASS
jgi:hypothetical protein